LNDDKSPLIDLLSCLVCEQTMKLEKSSPDVVVGTSFNIVANGVTELSWCDFSAEVELRRAEGEGKVDGPAFVDRIAALADDRGSYFNSDRLPGSCMFPEQGSRDSCTAFIALPDATAAEVRFFKPQE
jgi:hypothetical protein